MKKILDFTEEVIKIICISLTAIISVLGMLQVFFRYVIGSSLTFSEELMIFLFVWIIFLGSAIAIRRHAHAKVEFLLDRLSGRIKNVAILLVTLINIMFFSIIVVKGFEFALQSHNQQSIAMELPMSFVYVAIPVGALFMVIYSVEYLFDYKKKNNMAWKE